MLIEVIDTGENHLVVWANETALGGRFGNGIIDKDVTQFIPAGDFVLRKIVESIMENLLKADERLYKAKRSGKNCSRIS